MAVLFYLTFLYTLAATALTLILQGSWDQALADFTTVALTISKFTAGSEAKFLVPALLLIWWMGHLKSAARLRLTALISVSAILLQVGFFFMKSAIPRLVPFYADPFFADLDRALLLGHDAWQFTHALTPEALAGAFPFLYSTVWTAFVFAFPILLAASDPDELRLRRYVGLFFLTWPIIGKLLALAGSSVGPVFYDQLLDSDRFALMHQSFDRIGYSATPMAALQTWLWENSGARISFISAFPSMHVALAAVGTIYVRERFRRFRIIGDLFFLSILWISVYSGYHYLVDGLAGLILVAALNAALHRWIGGRSAGKAGPGEGSATQSAESA